MKDIRNKMQEILKDINMVDDINLIKARVLKGFDEIITEIEEIQRESEEKERMILEKQQEIEMKADRIEKTLESIQNELYIEDSYDFEIACPYCNTEFTIEYDEEQSEVKCPECNNTIELNWTGDLEEDGCSGSCSHCLGCNHVVEDEKEE